MGGVGAGGGLTILADWCPGRRRGGAWGATLIVMSRKLETAAP